MTVTALNPPATAKDSNPWHVWNIFDQCGYSGDPRSVVNVSVRQTLETGAEPSYLAFTKATPEQLQAIYRICWAANEAFSNQHGVPLNDTPGVLAELKKIRDRDRARQIHAAEQQPDTDYSDLYLERSQLAAMDRGSPLIHGVIDRHALAVITGRDQSYKSFLALDWLLCLATGTPWQGHQVEQCPVLYVVGEGAWGLDSRVAAWEHHHGIDVPASTFLVRRAPVNLFRGGSDLDELLERVERSRAGLVVFDTLRRCSAGANMNLEADAGLVITNLDRVRDVTDNGTVGYVAHTDKGDNDARGSGVIEDDADIVWRAKKLGDDTIKFSLSKRKDGPDGLTHLLEPKTVDGTGSLVLAESSGIGGGEREDLMMARAAVTALERLWALDHVKEAARTVVEQAISVKAGTDKKRGGIDLAVAKRMLVERKEGNRRLYSLPGVDDS